MTMPYPMEFVPDKQRALITVLPSWPIGVCLFVLFAYFLEDWVYLHLSLAAISAPMLIFFFFVPESVRWSSVHGRVDEAYKAFEKMAMINGKTLPEDTMKVIQNVAEEEKISRENGRKYSYIDVFRGPGMVKTTLSMVFIWSALSLVFYGISFGVSSLAGNVYLNIFLLNVLDIPANLSTYFLSNRFGRRVTCSGLFLLGAASAFGVMAVQLAGPESGETVIVTVLTIISKCSVSAAWAASAAWILELYPTVTRNLAYAVVNMSARIGGIVAPFVINLDDQFILSFTLIGGLLLISTVLAIQCRETKGLTLADSYAMADHKMTPNDMELNKDNNENK